MTIIQITAKGDTLYGLDNFGDLYYWNENMNDWTKVGA